MKKLQKVLMSMFLVGLIIFLQSNVEVSGQYYEDIISYYEPEPTTEPSTEPEPTTTIPEPEYRRKRSLMDVPV